MNKGQFENIITNPSKMDYVKDLPLLKELIESFPYFSSSYLLMTKLLYRERSIYTEKYIKLTASYIGDREILYNFLYAPEPEAANIEELLPEVVSIPEVANIVPETPEPIVIAESNSEVKEVEEVKEEPTIIPLKTTPSLVPLEADFDYFAAYKPELKVPVETTALLEPIAKPFIPPPAEVFTVSDIIPSNNSFSGWLNFLNTHPAPKKQGISLPKQDTSLPEFENIESHPKILIVGLLMLTDFPFLRVLLTIL